LKGVHQFSRRQLLEKDPVRDTEVVEREGGGRLRSGRFFLGSKESKENTPHSDVWGCSKGEKESPEKELRRTRDGKREVSHFVRRQTSR